MSLGSYRKLLMKPFPALLVLCLKRCWAASLMPYALRRKYHSEEHPSITRRSHSFQFILGEPTRGLTGIYFNVIFIIASLDYVLLYHINEALSTVISVIICYILYQCNILNITHMWGHVKSLFRRRYLGGGSRLDSKENTQSITLCGVWGGAGWSLRGAFVVALPWGGPLILSGWV